MRKGIAVWGHFHGGNIGDDIVVSTLIANIRQRLPSHEIHAFSLNPSDTARRHEVPASSLLGSGIVESAAPGINKLVGFSDMNGAETPEVPRRTDMKSRSSEAAPRLGLARLPLLKRALAFVRKARRKVHGLTLLPATWAHLLRFDAVIVAGSGPLFDDMGGPWVHPYNLWRWALLCRLSGTKFCLLNVGAGPVNRPLSRWFLKHALRLSYYHSFRDQSSADLAVALGASKSCDRHCDMAFAVSESELENARSNPLTSSNVLIGIAPMAYMDASYWPNADASIADRYIKALATLTVALMDRGFDIVLLKSQRRADERTASKLLEQLREMRPRLDETRIHNPVARDHQDLLRFIAGCQLVVGGRFHCHVLPFVLGIPVIGISYHPKTEELMRTMGQEDYLVSMDAVDGSQLIDLFNSLTGEREQVIGKIAERSRHFRSELNRQFDEILSRAFLST